jgi:hypothetical protein
MAAPIVAAAVRKATTWLAKRSANVSKHVGLHASAAATHVTRPWVMSKAMHSVFRTANPKKLILKALRSFDRSIVQGARSYGRRGHVVIEKAFDRIIGRNGERILRVVIDQTTGKIVTAFPVHEFMIAASGVAAVALVDIVSDSIDEVDVLVARRLAAKEAALANRSTGVKVIEFLIDVLIDPSVANENEDIMLAIDAHHDRKANEYVAKVQQLELRSLDVSGVKARRQEYFDAMAGVAAADLES